MTTNTRKPRRNYIAEEARRQADMVQRVTGEWWCQSGSHYVKGDPAPNTKRRICQPCKKRLDAFRKPSPGLK